MITGYNTDVEYKGIQFHIQTEDKGKKNPVIETLLYRGGMIVASRRTPYNHLLKFADFEAKLKALMLKQHRSMIEDLKRGVFDRYIPELGGRPMPSEDLSEALLSRLEELKKLRLRVEAVATDQSGLRMEVKVTTGEDEPVRDAGVRVYLKPAQQARKLLAEAKTDQEGRATLSVSLPDPSEDLMIILFAEKKELGKDEKWIKVE